MIDEFAKEHLHDHLRWAREALVWKLDGLSRVRHPPAPDLDRDQPSRPGQAPGDLESRYFGEVFGRPFPEPLPRWDDEAAAAPTCGRPSTRPANEIIGLYRRAWEHSDATIAALAIDAPGHVPWWPRPDVKLFNIMVHVLTETTRHAGHADILREQLDGTIGIDARKARPCTRHDAAFWEAQLREDRAGRQGSCPVTSPK